MQVSRDFLFMNSGGQPVKSSVSFPRCIERAFELRNGGLKFTTTSHRKSLVNWLTTTEKSEDVRKSVARLMSHIGKMQKLRYDTMESKVRLKTADIISRESGQVLGLTENN